MNHDDERDHAEEQDQDRQMRDEQQTESRAFARQLILEQVRADNVYRSGLAGREVWFWDGLLGRLTEAGNAELELVDEVTRELLAAGLVDAPPDGASFFTLTDAGAAALAAT